MSSKEQIRNTYLQKELTQEVLLDYIVDLKYEIEGLKNKKTTLPKKSNTQNETPSKTPVMNFHEYKHKYLFSGVKNYLQYALENDLSCAIKKLFEENIFENIPIYCTNSRATSFYIFDDLKWEKMDIQSLNNFISDIIQEFVIVFNTDWIQINQHKIVEGGGYEQYMDYFAIIVGKNENHQEKIISQVRPYLTKLYKL